MPSANAAPSSRASTTLPSFLELLCHNESKGAIRELPPPLILLSPEPIVDQLCRLLVDRAGPMSQRTQRYKLSSPIRLVTNPLVPRDRFPRTMWRLAIRVPAFPLIVQLLLLLRCLSSARHPQIPSSNQPTRLGANPIFAQPRLLNSLQLTRRVHGPPPQMRATQIAPLCSRSWPIFIECEYDTLRASPLSVLAWEAWSAPWGLSNRPLYITHPHHSKGMFPLDGLFRLGSGDLSITCLPGSRSSAAPVSALPG